MCLEVISAAFTSPEESLLGVYLRGSYAARCERPGESDLDLIVLVKGSRSCPSATSPALQALREYLEAARRASPLATSITKIEAKVLFLPPSAPLAPYLESLRRPSLLPLRARSPAPGALLFQLKTQSITLQGPDVPSLLPAEPYARPTPIHLHKLEDDMQAALRGVPEGTTETDHRRRTVWSHSRLLRAAFELTEFRDGVYTRDLCWSAAYAALQFPELRPHLQRSQMHVAAALASTTSASAAVAAAPRFDFEAAARDAEDFALAMIRLRAANERKVGAPGTPSAAAASSPSLPFTPSRKDALRRSLLLLRGPETHFVSRPLPEFKGKVRPGGVRTVDVANAAELQSASAFLTEYALGSLPPALQEPILFKGAVTRHWSAVQQWTLDFFLRELPWFRGTARIAPTLTFPFCEPALLRDLAQTYGAHRMPSNEAVLTMTEFLARCQRPGSLRVLGSLLDLTLPNLFYDGQEYLYLQADLPPALRSGVSFDVPPFFLSQGPGGGAPTMHMSQGPRLWLSPRGSVSPLHYDASASFLTQVRGRKRMLLYRPEDLDRLYPYPDDSLLRRRARVDPTAPDYAKFPAFREAEAVAAVLEPGDVLFFPPRFAHYTESLDLSVSITARFRSRAAGARGTEGGPGAGEGEGGFGDSWGSPSGSMDGDLE